MSTKPMMKFSISGIAFKLWDILSRIGRGMNDYRLLGLLAVVLAASYWLNPTEYNSTMSYLTRHGDRIPEFLSYALFISGMLMIFGHTHNLGIAFLLTVPLQFYLLAMADNVRLSEELPYSIVLLGVLVAIIIYRYLIKLLYIEIIAKYRKQQYHDVIQQTKNGTGNIPVVTADVVALATAAEMPAIKASPPDTFFNPDQKG